MRYHELLEDASPNEYVFVYGSLKHGFGNHSMIAPAQFVGIGRTPPRFDMLDLGGFPAAIPGKHSMIGEVYEVDPATMEILDRLESNGYMYLRRKVPVLVRGRQMPAWVYLFLLDSDADLVKPEGNSVTWTQYDA